MPALTLGRYLQQVEMTPHEFAKSIGRNHQSVYQWIQADARIDFTEVGVKITVEKQLHPKTAVVHETQVAK